MTAEPATTAVAAADVEQAARLLDGVARRTPVESSRALSERLGGPVWLKCENLQRTGSFKLRGAYVRMARLTADERARGVVAASAGNHAQGVALAARLLGIPALVVMPEGAPLPKVAATAGYGAQLRLAGSSVDEALAAAAKHAARTGAVLIHPFDHPDVVAGQGSVGGEILQQRPEVRTILVSLGGGGLAAGIAVAVKASRPDVRVVGVQAAGAAAWPASLAAGRPVPLTSMATIADGIAVACPGRVTFPLVAELVDEVVTVSDEAISRALVHCLERTKLVVEPAGAVPIAALLDAEPGRFFPPVVAVLSGGNVDPLLLLRVIHHGLVAAGRYLSLRLRILDRPGSLARLLDVLADAGANVLDIEHRRIRAGLDLNEVDVELDVETRGSAHADEVLDALRDAGYTPAAR